MANWEETFWQKYADKETLTYKWTNPLAMRDFIVLVMKDIESEVLANCRIKATIIYKPIGEEEET